MLIELLVELVEVDLDVDVDEVDVLTDELVLLVLLS